MILIKSRNIIKVSWVFMSFYMSDFQITLTGSVEANKGEKIL